MMLGIVDTMKGLIIDDRRNVVKLPWKEKSTKSNYYDHCARSNPIPLLYPVTLQYSPLFYCLDHQFIPFYSSNHHLIINELQTIQHGYSFFDYFVVIITVIFNDCHIINTALSLKESTTIECANGNSSCDRNDNRFKGWTILEGTTKVTTDGSDGSR